MIPTVSLALQGGGSHGAFSWGVLDRLLQEVGSGRLAVSAVSGTSAGALNAALMVSGLAQGGSAAGGADLAQRKLEAFWRGVSRQGARAGNDLFFAEPSLFGFNLDYSPVGIALEAAGLVVSPYTNPFYQDALAPLLADALTAQDLAAINSSDLKLFATATNVTTNGRRVFTQPGITLDTLRASAALPSLFRAVFIDGDPYWDGGYLGNPALNPLLPHADDLLLVLVNALHRDGMPPRGARGILDRLNEITFNASVVLELNAVQAINTMLAELAAAGTAYAGRYRTIRTHAIRNDAFVESLGFVSKSATSWSFLSTLHDAGYETADQWLRVHEGDVGRTATFDAKKELALL